MQNLADISVIILTKNEEVNLSHALKSVIGWAREVCVLDSFSDDKTIEIANSYNCKVLQNKFINYAKQRNFALENFQINTEWIFFLDADEHLTDELKNEITQLILNKPIENGFFVRWKMIWMGTHIKHGYYGTWLLRMCRYGYVSCENRAVNEHLIVTGKTGYLKNDFIHEDHKLISDWIIKHNRYADMEAYELYTNGTEKENYREIEVNLFGTQAQRKRWLRYKLWNKLPPIIRPWFYFCYRYFFLGGFLDGKNAFIYHFMHALWYPLLIDGKFIELKSGSMQCNSEAAKMLNRTIDESTDISVVILTYNEECNLPQALSSVKNWAKEIFVLDSFSADDTVKIAKDFGCKILQHKFKNYGDQYNFAINNFEINTEWVFVLDADEWMPDALQHEISNLIKTKPIENGFFVRWKMIWLNKWIKRGYSSNKIIRLYRKGYSACEDRIVNEHLVVQGQVGDLNEYFVHESHKSLGEWICKHDQYASMEALSAIDNESNQFAGEIDAKFWGAKQPQRKRWLRYNIWDKLPKIFRAFFYFFYRYFLTGAFIEGRIAFLYHFFHALWYPMLIDIKYKELKQKR